MENTFYSAFDFQRFSGESPEKDFRSPFQRDRDRIIHTSAFRRLQSKTQVFLSGEYDFYRTRLTHSIEVAQIGRSLCNYLNRTSADLNETFFIDQDLVEAACLSHDLGHPPFGHTGEKTLHRLMKPYGGFEGNAQTLRLLTEIIFSKQNRGMDPSRAFIDSVLKYKTLYTELDHPENHFLYGTQEPELNFTLSDNAFPAELTPGKRRNAFRSIECQLMDWADDTAYSLNDLADGIHAGFITLEKLTQWGETTALDKENAHHLEIICQVIREQRIESFIGKKIGHFLTATQLERDANFMSALTHRYNFLLIVDPQVRKESEFYKKIALDLVFNSQQLEQLDYKADHILSTLFQVLEKQYIRQDRDQQHFHLLTPLQEKSIATAQNQKERARIVCDVIASMSDGFATRTYKRLFDPDFGSIVDLL